MPQLPTTSNNISEWYLINLLFKFHRYVLEEKDLIVCSNKAYITYQLVFSRASQVA